MTVETHIHHARKRVESERTVVASKREGFDSFTERVKELSASGPNVEQAGQAVAGGIAARSVTQGTDQRERVRSAFAETVGQQTDADSVLLSLQQELSEDVALALAPTTNASFTPQLQRQLLTQVTAREQELAVTDSALRRELDSIETHLDTVDSVVTWLVENDETPLSELSFPVLRTRHEKLEEFRQTCNERIAARQELLAATTSEDGQVGVSHRGLVESLYENFPVDYPVLATTTRLLDACDDAQRAVRDHLVRRV
ncbi:MAG: hypothetical protein V5A45_04720 [Haloarculaceae archaeon]